MSFETRKPTRHRGPERTRHTPPLMAVSTKRLNTPLGKHLKSLGQRSISEFFTISSPPSTPQPSILRGERPLSSPLLRPPTATGGFRRESFVPNASSHWLSL